MLWQTTPRHEDKLSLPNRQPFWSQWARMRMECPLPIFLFPFIRDSPLTILTHGTFPDCFKMRHTHKTRALTHVQDDVSSSKQSMSLCIFTRLHACTHHTHTVFPWRAAKGVSFHRAKSHLSLDSLAVQALFEVGRRLLASVDCGHPVDFVHKHFAIITENMRGAPVC